MKAYPTVRAVLALAMAVLIAAPLGTAGAQPFGRPMWRVAEREARGRPQARAQPAPRQIRPYGGQVRPYGGSAYGPARTYAYPQAYPPPYAPPAAGYAQRPGYAPNSLGAEWGQQQDEARRGVRQGLQPLGRVMANIGRVAPGSMLDAGLERLPDGRTAYRVRWAAANGRRIDFIVDAATGAIIGSSGY
jgi:hypothetical protein